MTYLLLPHLHILNANAMSSTYTIGFPAMTAWLGSIHALQRKLREDDGMQQVHFCQMAVCSHKCQLQTYRRSARENALICLTRNPQNKKDKLDKPAAIIEEPRIHLDISLLVQCEGVNGTNEKKIKQVISNILQQMKIAGGDITSFGTPEILYTSDNELEGERKILYRLMPGYVLIERRDLVEKEMKAGKDGLDALLSYIAIEHKVEEGGHWTSQKKEGGWLVPIAVGFKGISDLGKVENQRDPEKMHRFAESIVTLGEFRMPYRFTRVSDILWHYEYDEDNGMYICKNESIGGL